MGKYSQKDRAFQVKVPSLGEDVLLLEGFSGEEHVSAPFSFHLELVSEDDSIAAADVLRKPFVLLMKLPDGTDRPIHGICAQFSQHGKDEGLTSYEARIVPWIHFLSLNNDCKIFQEKSVIEIIKEVFGKYDIADYEVKCLESYSPRQYCVQYRESDLNFVSRLMEEEGIFYFFQHSESGHKLILADDGSAIEKCEGQDYFRVTASADARVEEDVITGLEWEHQVYTNKVTLTDYDPLHPSMNLESTASDDEHEELYDYPGLYTELSAGERYASLLLEERAAGYQVARGTGKCRSFRSGYKFKLSEHYRNDVNQDYLLLSIWHTGHSGGYRTSEEQTEYSNQFECVPASVTFRPPRRAEKPVVRGLQTALVVGPAGEEVYTDKHGRIKVQFYWDRVGSKDDNSSCWIRVASPWAGKGYGNITIPRMGNEVVVDFLEGDPDRPLVVGSVYNADQAPPFGLPGADIQMGMKSRSSKGGGGYNEITLIDTKGEELINVHGQKDRHIVIENDDTESVGNNQSVSVGKNRTESVGADETIGIGGNRSESVGKDESIGIDGNRTESVGKDESIAVTGNRTRNVGKSETVNVDKDRSITIAGKQETDVGKKRSTQVGDDDELNVGNKLTVQAGDEILLKTGSATIQMKKDGTILIKGKDVKIQASGKISAKASSDITLKGSQIKEN